MNRRCPSRHDYVCNTCGNRWDFCGAMLSENLGPRNPSCRCCGFPDVDIVRCWDKLCQKSGFLEMKPVESETL